MKVVMSIDSILKYCCFALLSNNEWVIYPTDSIKKYWKYLKYYSYESEDNILDSMENHDGQFVCFDLDTNILNKKPMSLGEFVDQEDFLIFEFDNEDDAFYFKLKYC